MSVLIVSLLILGAIVAVFVLAAQGEMLASKGIKWWTILIPGYGEYVFFKTTADCGLLLWMMLGMAVLGIVSSFLAPIFGIFFLILLLFFYFIFSLNLAEAYNRDLSFAIGLFLLPPVFFWMLAYPSEKTEPYDRKLLRLLSLAFAVGLVIVSVGLGGLFYKNRTDILAFTAAYENFRPGEYTQAGSDELADGEAAEEEAGEVPETDAEGTDAETAGEEPATDAGEDSGTAAEETAELPAEAEDVDTAADEDAAPVPYTRYKVVQDSGREKFGWAFLRADAAAAMKAELPVSEYDKMITRKRQVSRYQAALADVILSERVNFGFRYYMLEAGVWGAIFLVVGGLIMAAALTFWILYGGRPSNIRETVFWIPCLALIAVGVAFLCAGTAMKPLSDDIWGNLMG